MHPGQGALGGVGEGPGGAPAEPQAVVKKRFTYLKSFPAGTILDVAPRNQGTTATGIATASSKGATAKFNDISGKPVPTRASKFATKKIFKAIPWYDDRELGDISEQHLASYDKAVADDKKLISAHCTQYIVDRPNWEWQMFELARQHIGNIHWSSTATTNAIQSATRDHAIEVFSLQRVPAKIRQLFIKNSFSTTRSVQ